LEGLCSKSLFNEEWQGVVKAWEEISTFADHGLKRRDSFEVFKHVVVKDLAKGSLLNL